MLVIGLYRWNEFYDDYQTYYGIGLTPQSLAHTERKVFQLKTLRYLP